MIEHRQRLTLVQRAETSALRLVDAADALDTAESACLDAGAILSAYLMDVGFDQIAQRRQLAERRERLRQLRVRLVDEGWLEPLPGEE